MTDGKRLYLIEELASIAQNGLAFASDKFDVERYQQLRGIAAELGAEISGNNIDRVQEFFALDTHYATPKLDVRAIVLDSEKVLLTQELSDGKWTLPGGWSDINCSPAESVEKEVREETGLEVKAHRLLGLCDKQKHDYPPQIPHAYKAFFHCLKTGGQLIKGTLETSDAEFFDLDNLPELSPDRVSAGQLQRMVTKAITADPLADFD